MGPLRNTTRINYDPELPENWTLSRLKDELRQRNITFPQNARRMALVRLFRNRATDTSRMDSELLQHTTIPRMDTLQDPASPVIHVLSSARSRDSVVVNNNNNHGRPQSDTEKTLTDIVSRLTETIQNYQTNMTNTVQTMQRSLINLNNKVNAISNPSNVSETLTPLSLASPGPSSVSQGVNQVENAADSIPIYNLDTAYSALKAGNSRPSAAAGSEEQARRGNLAPTSRGYSAEALPFVESVSTTIRRNIISGRDVNLATLLIPYYTGSGVIETVEGDDIKSIRPDPRVNRSLSLGEFIQAFGIYKNIMCSARPYRRQELDLYERDIIDMATRYPGNGFYDYHKKFSLDAAAHLTYNNIVIDWSIRNNTLFCNIFANARTNSCAFCGSPFHASNFCHLSLNHVNQRNGRRMDDKDMYGRERILYNGKEICNNFNGVKGCNVKHCRNQHVCIVCKGDHPKINCLKQTKNEQAGSQQNGTQFISKK